MQVSSRSRVERREARDRIIGRYFKGIGERLNPYSVEYYEPELKLFKINCKQGAHPPFFPTSFDKLRPNTILAVMSPLHHCREARGHALGYVKLFVYSFLTFDNNPSFIEILFTAFPHVFLKLTFSPELFCYASILQCFLRQNHQKGQIVASLSITSLKVPCCWFNSNRSLVTLSIFHSSSY